ncbi:dienelactone hydrolase family protein [Noviherbaspirillum sp. ST9]|uniref:dienelactone hydrolase family protein n=1 Tax=Noviherbaspirillum sp. ST9 TaxID=3401606 RepID=UPI003B587F26
MSTRVLLRSALLVCLTAFGSAAQCMDRVSIPSLDYQLELNGYWFPAASAEPRPAVVVLHGCGGAVDDQQKLNPGYFRDASYFNAERMHLLALDSFTSRGLRSICEIPRDRRTVSEENRRDDVFAALRWLAQQPGVDSARIVVVGRSHGGQTALSVLDRTEKAVKEQAIKPKAVVALYPGCSGFLKMWNYELVAPLLLMIGESDDWTPARACIQLREKVMRAQKDAVFEMHVFPDSHHGFDGMTPPYTKTNVAGTRSGTATVGGNPAAREKAHRLMFDFISAQLNEPLRLTHEERFLGHLFEVPQASGYADINDVAALPGSEKARARYEKYLADPSPKAFVITEKGGWAVSAGKADAMQASLSFCKNVKCWLYAVDDRVVWQAEPANRIDQAKLVRKDR